MTIGDFLMQNPMFISTFLTGFILPLFLVWMNLNATSKLKDREKEIEQKHKINNDIKELEKAVYASLSKMLFDIQLLYVALSGSCVDQGCIEEALKKFDESIVRYHGEIANNLLYMPSEIINLIYRFYGEVSDLKIRLREFDETKNYKMAHVAVNLSSTGLAKIVIEVQDKLLSKNEVLKMNFNKAHQEMMLYCCGKRPPRELFDEYIILLRQIKPELTDEEISELTSNWRLREVHQITEIDIQGR
ncbi:hypothetical protein [Chitinophaga defluvii]|uniref:Phage abortive infection protein n=1 Tax=Chitinophaga defluvii TaxID=3163343 RepID=A0ABV2T1E7_9BACT